MRTFRICVAFSLPFVIAVGCKKQDDTQQPNAAATATGYPGYPGGYPPPQGTAGQYPPPQGQPYPGTPAPTYGQYPQPQPMPTAAPVPAPTGASPPAASGQMAVPGPVAFQCQNDVPCGTHRCNLQYGKCAFPCQSNVDCLTPNQCIMGLCVPAPPQAH